MFNVFFFICVCVCLGSWSQNHAVRAWFLCRAAIIRSISHTISGWAGFAFSHLSVHLLRKSQRNMESLFCWLCGWPFGVLPTHFEPLRLSKPLQFSIRDFWHLYSAQKPNYSDWIWLPSHIRTDSPTVLYSARQPCAVRCLVMIG